MNEENEEKEKEEERERENKTETSEMGWRGVCRETNREKKTQKVTQINDILEREGIVSGCIVHLQRILGYEGRSRRREKERKRRRCYREGRG